MALSTYSDLLAAVSNWLGGRTDLNAFIPDFVTLFEAAANRRVRVLQMETAVALAMTSTGGPLPTDFLAARHVTWISDTRRELEYVTPQWLALNYPTNPTGTPAVYTIEDAFLKIRPIDTTPNTTWLDYYQRIPALSGTLNWLYSRWPDAYLFGTLAESADFTSGDNQLQKWIARRDAIFEEIERLDRGAKGVGGIRIAGPTP